MPQARLAEQGAGAAGPQVGSGSEGHVARTGSKAKVCYGGCCTPTACKLARSTAAGVRRRRLRGACVCANGGGGGGGVREAQTHGTKPAVQSQNTLFLYDARSRLEDAALRRICRRLDLKPCFDDVQLVGLPRTRARTGAKSRGRVRRHMPAAQHNSEAGREGRVAAGNPGTYGERHGLCYAR